MTKFEERIEEVSQFLKNNDIVLGYRKLMDCVTDTQNLDIYRDIIELTDWKEKNPNQEEVLIEKSLKILETVSQEMVPEYDISKPIISAENIKKNYGHNRFELGPISLKIKKSNVYGLVGENGNGKTTLLRVLANELKSTEGTIDYNFDNAIKSSFQLRSNLVYIPQRTKKWYGSLKDNLKFVLASYGVPAKENETRVLMIIARLGLWNYKHLKWSELSSGYKMRFELARTLLRKPEVLLLDEPLANLDVLAQQVILEDLKSICNSVNNPIALILSSQQLYEVEKVSDKVIYLKDGKYKENISNTIEKTTTELIVELDCNASRETLTKFFNPLQLNKLVFNGGIYIAYFSTETPFASVLETLGKHKIEVTYIRNISDSTRRFFVS